MRYRTFLKHCRRYRQETTPDIRDRLPLAAPEPRPAPARRPLPLARRCAAMAAAVTVLTAAVAAALLWREGGSDREPPLSAVGQPESSAASVDVIMQIPAWYSPGHLSVSPFYYEDTPLNEADGFGGIIDTRLLDLTGRYHQPDHEDCSGVYFDLKTGEVVCLTHQIREALKEQGLGDDQTRVGVHVYRPGLGKALFTLSGKPGKPSYCFDTVTREIIPLQVSINQSVYHAGGPGEPLADCPYHVASVPRVKAPADDVYLIDLRTGEQTNILKSGGRYMYDTMDDVHLSPGGGYALYTISGDAETVNSPARTTAVYHIATGETALVQGEIIHELPDDSRLILRTPEGMVVYTCATGEQVPLEEAEDLPAQYGYRIRTTDRYTDDCSRLAVENLLTGEQTPVSDAYIHAWTLSRDSRYLYTFTRGESSISCMEIATGSTFRQPLEERFLSVTEGEENRDRMLLFEVHLDEESGTLLLGYSVTDAPRQDPEAVRQELEADPSYQLSQLFQIRGVPAIADFAPLMERLPDRFDLYQGDGFLYMAYHRVYTADGGNTSGIYLILEDYRTGRLYSLQHDGMDFGSAFSISEIVPLPKGAQEATQALIRRLSLSCAAPPLDYGDYIVDGELDTMRVLYRATAPSRMMSLTDAYFVSRQDYDGAKIGLEGEDAMAKLAEFLQFAYGLDYRYMSGEEWAVFGPLDYYISLSSQDIGYYLPNIDFGQRGGKYYVMYYNRLAEISREEYERWLPWLEECSRACILPPA